MTIVSAANMLAVRAFLSNTFLAIFVFLIKNVESIVVGVLDWSYLLFSTNKNHNAGVSVLATKAFLSNIFLIVFAFLIINREKAIKRVLG